MRNYKLNSLHGTIGWLVASVFYAYHLSVISVITVLPDELMDLFQISATQYGMISVMYTFAYAAMQIPVGILLDHCSIKKLITTSIFMFSVGCLLLAFTTYYPLILIIRFVMGIAAAFSVLGGLRLAADWFSSDHFATLAGLTVSLGYFGGIIGNKIVFLLQSGVTLSHIFFISALFGFLLTIASFLFVDNFSKIDKEHNSVSQIASDIKSIVSNKQSIMIMLYAMLIFTPLVIFKDGLGVMFFKSYYKLDQITAATMMDVILFASILAAPALGIISDRLGKRKPIITLTPIVQLSCFLAILFRIDQFLFINPVIVIGIIFAVFAFATWGFLLSYSVFKETHDTHIVSTGLGLMNSLNMCGFIVLVPIITSLIDAIPYFYPGISIADDYFYAFLVLPVIILLALPTLKYLPETNCKQLHD